MGIIVLGSSLLCAMVGDNGPESKIGQIIWYGIIGGPVIWIVGGIAYCILWFERR